MSLEKLLKLAAKFEKKLAHQNPALPPPPATPPSKYYGQGQQWHEDVQWGRYNPKATHQFDADGMPFNYNSADEVVGWHRHPFGDFYAEPGDDPREE